MKDDKLYRYHIIESIEKIFSYVDGLSREEFLETNLL